MLGAGCASQGPPITTQVCICRLFAPPRPRKGGLPLRGPQAPGARARGSFLAPPSLGEAPKGPIMHIHFPLCGAFCQWAWECEGLLPRPHYSQPEQ